MRQCLSLHDFKVIDLFVKVLSKFRSVKMFFFPVEVDTLSCILLFFRFATLLEEGMLKAFINRKAEIGVEH